MTFRIFAFCALLGLTACATSPASHYYLLTPAENAASHQTRVAAMPPITVTIPAYLDRPQIVFDDGDGRVDIRAFDRWAEPLDGMIRRVLTQDMQTYTVPTQRVLAVTIDDFTFGGGAVTLRAHWTNAKPSSNAGTAPSYEFAASIPVAIDDVAASVIAMNGLLDALAQKMAATLR